MKCWQCAVGGRQQLKEGLGKGRESNALIICCGSVLGALWLNFGVIAGRLRGLGKAKNGQGVPGKPHDSFFPQAGGKL